MTALLDARRIVLVTLLAALAFLLITAMAGAPAFDSPATAIAQEDDDDDDDDGAAPAGGVRAGAGGAATAAGGLAPAVVALSGLGIAGATALAVRARRTDR